MDASLIANEVLDTMEKRKRKGYSMQVGHREGL